MIRLNCRIEGYHAEAVCRVVDEGMNENWNSPTLYYRRFPLCFELLRFEVLLYHDYWDGSTYC